MSVRFSAGSRIWQTGLDCSFLPFTFQPTHNFFPIFPTSFKGPRPDEKRFLISFYEFCLVFFYRSSQFHLFLLWIHSTFLKLWNNCVVPSSPRNKWWEILQAKEGERRKKKESLTHGAVFRLKTKHVRWNKTLCERKTLWQLLYKRRKNCFFFSAKARVQTQN